MGGSLLATWGGPGGPLAVVQSAFFLLGGLESLQLLKFTVKYWDKQVRTQTLQWPVTHRSLSIKKSGMTEGSWQHGGAGGSRSGGSWTRRQPCLSVCFSCSSVTWPLWGSMLIWLVFFTYSTIWPTIPIVQTWKDRSVPLIVAGILGLWGMNHGQAGAACLSKWIWWKQTHQSPWKRLSRPQ